MKIVKKLLKIVGIFFLLLIAALIVIPVVFKDSIAEKIKEVANDNVNAQIDFGEYSLSLISTFPDFSFEINDVSVINKAPFEGDTLAYIGSLNLELDLGSVFSGDYTVSNFELDNLIANAKVLEDGTANWDIAIPDTAAVEEVVEEEVEEAPVEEGENPLVAGLESFSISNVNINYVDMQSGMIAIVKDFHQKGSFKMEGDHMDIPIETGIESVTFMMEGEKLAHKLKFESEVDMKMDMKSMTFTFHENQFKFNELKVGLDGSVVLSDDITFDLMLSAKDNKFKDLLSLIPAVYTEDFAGLETKGDFSLTAKLNGVMDDEHIPGFDVDFSINNGYLKYPDLPESIHDINMELAIDNKDGIIDHTVIDLSLFNLKVANNPIDFKLRLKDIESDPDIKGSIHSKLKLENLSKVLPMEEGEEYKGGITANLEFAGKQSSIDNERYEEFKAEGKVYFDGLEYKTSDLPEVLVKTGYLYFSPQAVEVSNFEMKIGKSDLVANGKIDNMLSYVFHDTTLVGSLDLKSNFFDLNELMAEDSTVVEEVEDAEVAEAMHATHTDTITASEEGVIEVPANIDFVLSTSFKKIEYDTTPIDNFRGNVIVRNEVLTFKDNGLEILGGEITLDGYYSTQDKKNPKTEMDLSIKKMGIGEAYKAFNTVQKMAPIAKNATGDFDTDVHFVTQLNDSMSPVYETLNGKGFLATTNLGIAETDAWKGMIKALKVSDQKFNKIKAEDVKINYEFKDGRLYTQPFKLNMGDVKGEVSGWTSFDNKIEYTYALKVPTKMFGAAAGAMSSLSSLAGNAGMNVSMGEYMNVNIIVTGDMDDPKYKVNLGGSEGEKSMKDQAVDAVKEKVAEKVDELKEKGKEEIDKAKKEAEAKAKAEIEAAKKQAKAKADAEKARLKKEAEDKAKKELEKKGKGALKGLGF